MSHAVNSKSTLSDCPRSLARSWPARCLLFQSYLRQIFAARSPIFEHKTCVPVSQRSGASEPPYCPSLDGGSQSGTIPSANLQVTKAPRRCDFELRGHRVQSARMVSQCRIYIPSASQNLRTGRPVDEKQPGKFVSSFHGRPRYHTAVFALDRYELLGTLTAQWSSGCTPRGFLVRR